jgi:hypothetical protein
MLQFLAHARSRRRPASPKTFAASLTAKLRGQQQGTRVPSSQNGLEAVAAARINAADLFWTACQKRAQSRLICPKFKTAQTQVPTDAKWLYVGRTAENKTDRFRSGDNHFLGRTGQNGVKTTQKAPFAGHQVLLVRHTAGTTLQNSPLLEKLRNRHKHGH